MHWTLEVGGVTTQLCPPESVWRATIRAGTPAAAGRIANLLDEASVTRELEADEARLRQIIREEHDL